MFTQEQLNQLINDSLPSLVEGMKAELKNSITWEVKSKASSLVAEHVTNWIMENLIPEITTILVESKEGLIGVGRDFANEATEAITEALLKELKENLSTSYKRSGIMKALFE